MITITTPNLPDYVTAWSCVFSVDPAHDGKVYVFRWTIDGKTMTNTWDVANAPTIDLTKLSTKPVWQSWWSRTFAKSKAVIDEGKFKPITLRMVGEPQTIEDGEGAQ